MSYTEAIEDGVKTAKTGQGFNCYYPLCKECGAEVASWSYIRGLKYLCKKCKLEKALSDKEARADEKVDEKERKFLNAVNRISRAIKAKDVSAYETAANAVHKKLHNIGWFDSTEEIMVAIELVKSEVTARHQVKFGARYKADFVLPELKIVLEVDGTCFHNEFTKQREGLRDSLIVAALGSEWEVIRITDQMINENITRLIPAMIKVKERRKKVRDENEGRLPEWYTDRKMA